LTNDLTIGVTANLPVSRNARSGPVERGFGIGWLLVKEI
jgi:hypothetical protein